MSALPQDHAGTSTEREWRETIVEVENLREEYERRLGDGDGAGESNDRAIGRLWLRLWRAERRRDELLRRSD
jgi:hypothetical protein